MARTNNLLVEARNAERFAQRSLSVAEEVSRSKSEFIANMSHEFRTPLNAIIGYGEMLLESAQTDQRPEDEADGERLIGAAQRLRAMVDGMLRLSKIDQEELEIIECNVVALVQETVNAERSAIEATK